MPGSRGCGRPVHLQAGQTREPCPSRSASAGLIRSSNSRRREAAAGIGASCASSAGRTAGRSRATTTGATGRTSSRRPASGTPGVNDGRHTAGTLLIEQGVDIRTIQEILRPPQRHDHRTLRTRRLADGTGGGAEHGRGTVGSDRMNCNPNCNHGSSEDHRRDRCFAWSVTQSSGAGDGNRTRTISLGSRYGSWSLTSARPDLPVPRSSPREYPRAPVTARPIGHATGTAPWREVLYQSTETPPLHDRP